MLENKPVKKKLVVFYVSIALLIKTSLLKKSMLEKYTSLRSEFKARSVFL